MKSTGPKTAAGKSASARNSIKHGIFSQQALLPGESRRAFTKLARGLRDQLAPVGALEELFVEQMAQTAWRRGRIGNMEVEVLAQWRYDANGTDRGLGSALLRDEAHGGLFSQLARYQSALERSFYRSLHELQRLQASRAGVQVPLPTAIDIDISIETTEPETTEAADMGDLGELDD